MRTITELSKLNGKVYVYLRNETVAKKFLIDAEADGFTFGDGVKPTERDISDLFVVNRDWSISYVGWAGHMAYKSANCIGDQELIRIDYEKYILGFEDYLICKDENCNITLSSEKEN